MKNKPLKSIYASLSKHYGPQYWWPADSPFEVIVGAILTQNTAWSNVEKAIQNLKRANAISSPAKLSSLNNRSLALLIKPAGFYNLKTKRLKNFLNFLRDGYGSDLKKLAHVDTDELRTRLLAINGIGPETCDSILLYAFERPIFVVDAYTKRIFARMGIIDKKDDYDDIQAFFMKNLSPDTKLFNEYHALIVKLAKDFCRKKPKCGQCPLRKKFLACK